jgi:poly-gamma-glutamate synthesis protein (capsule biosynthesis protein)
MASLAALVTLFVSLAPQLVHAPSQLIERFFLLAAEPHATVLFGGDMMFDRHIREAMGLRGNDSVFACMDDVLKEPDVVVANLEGPITENLSMSVTAEFLSPEHFTFTFSTTTAELLARYNIRLVNIGNNHSMNFGRSGLMETKQWLDKAGISYFGDPDLVEEERVERVELNGIPFSFVNWSDWTPVGKPSASNGAGELNPTVAQIRADAESGRIVVVYTHWGEEYMATSSPRVQQLARSFVDAGAELVIGSHPHVVQEHEVYKGRHIYYSLGNLVFDQYWNDAVRTGLLVHATFTSEGLTMVHEIPTTMYQDGRTCLKDQ